MHVYTRGIFYRLLRTVVSSLKIPSRCYGFIFVDLYIHQLQTFKTVLIVINVVGEGLYACRLVRIVIVFQRSTFSLAKWANSALAKNFLNPISRKPICFLEIEG